MDGTKINKAGSFRNKLLNNYMLIKTNNLRLSMDARNTITKIN